MLWPAFPMDAVESLYMSLFFLAAFVSTLSKQCSKNKNRSRTWPDFNILKIHLYNRIISFLSETSRSEVTCRAHTTGRAFTTTIPLRFHYSFIHVVLKIAALVIIVSYQQPVHVCSVHCCAAEVHLDGNAAITSAPSCFLWAFSAPCNCTT